MRPYIAVALPRLLAGLALVLLGACVTTKTTGPAGPKPMVLMQSQPNQAWMVRAGGRTVGALVRFQELGSDRYLYSVRDTFGLDRGMVDAQGRAWRFRPHAEAEWTGTGTVIAGVASVLRLEAAVSLSEVAVGQVPALLEASLRR